MGPVTKATIVSMLESLHFQAVKAGLITKDQVLLYDEGVASGGVPPAVWLEWRGTACPFLPSMEIMPKKEQYRIIQGAIFALMALNINNTLGGTES